MQQFSKLLRGIPTCTWYTHSCLQFQIMNDERKKKVSRLPRRINLKTRSTKTQLLGTKMHSEPKLSNSNLCIRESKLWRMRKTCRSRGVPREWMKLRPLWMSKLLLQISWTRWEKRPRSWLMTLFLALCRNKQRSKDQRRLRTNK